MSKINATTTGIQNIGDTTPDIELQSGGVTKVVMKDDGRLYGIALHNSAGSVAGTTDQYVASGTYTPTLAGILNVATLTAKECQWIRVGNVVTVSGNFDFTTTTTLAATEVSVTPPIASTFALSSNAGGSGGIVAEASTTVGTYASGSLVKLYFSGRVATGASGTLTFSFTYVIL